MEFISTELAKKVYFKPERNAFGSQYQPWMIRATLRPVKNLTEAEAKELASFLNYKMKVALTEWIDQEDE